MKDKKKNGYFVLIFCLALGACAKPVAQVPRVETAQVQAAAEAQRLYAEDRPEKIFTTFKPAERRKRFSRVEPLVAEAGFELCLDMTNTPAECHFAFSFSNKREVNAWADGEAIFVTGPMVALTSNDEELAMVMAHEFAHNMLKHPQGTQVNAAIGGLIGAALDSWASAEGYGGGGELHDIGEEVGSITYSPEFEREADYIGLYIVARAGFSPEKAMQFWRRMSAYDPSGLEGGYTHPSNPERHAAMEQAIQEIKRKQGQGGVLLPYMKPNG